MSNSFGDAIRTAYNTRTRESMNRVFGQPDKNEPGEDQYVSADGGAHSPVMPQRIDANKILRNAIEESIGDRQMRRMWG
jgi:hypothetical protein